jgi:hypothetical protein
MTEPNYVFPAYTTPEERASAAAVDKRIVQPASSEPAAREEALPRATTLVVVGVREVNGQRFEHGAELPPGLLPPETVSQWHDQKWLMQYDASERRSLYRLFPTFSGCKEQEHL